MEVTEQIFSKIFALSEEKKAEAKAKPKKRYLFNEIKDQIGKTKVMQGIPGLRGAGKTVILLQLANEFADSIYVRSEQLLMRAISIYDFITYAKDKGFSHIFVDEVHLYPNWALDLKAAYDEGGATIYFSGSSALAIQEEGADLSRRAILRFLPPLSFREYLHLRYEIELPKVTVEDILDFKRRKELIKDIAPHANKITEYMNGGALPFSIEESNPQPIYENILSKIIRSDMASLKKIDINHVDTVYKMLGFIATSKPDKVNYHSISSSLGKNIYIVMEIIRLLKELGLLMAVPSVGSGARGARKEYKLLLSPPWRSIICKLRSIQSETGALREEFFVNHVRPDRIRYEKTERKRRTPDYRLDDVVFEVGGESKKKKTADYVVVDGLPFDEKRIPLALFGLLY
jgi:predicted AAA+ superfamily ATPase